MVLRFGFKIVDEMNSISLEDAASDRLKVIVLSLCVVPFFFFIMAFPIRGPPRPSVLMCERTVNIPTRVVALADITFVTNVRKFD